MRVTGSRLANYGRVEVFSNHTWVAVCDQGFSMQAARVVCRDLGYTEARPQCCSALGPLRSYYYSLTATNIGLVVNRCDGSETSLLNCSMSTTATCPSGKYASVLCSNDPIQETGELGGLPEVNHAMQKHHHVVLPCGQHHVVPVLCNSFEMQVHCSCCFIVHPEQGQHVQVHVKTHLHHRQLSRGQM